ncbi:CHASE domain-containing protein [Mycolicibacterium sp.]|uniref:CHASE domain-containing protein n=1 Tax=Mycolicibacterium sp. TaxID=2320850 RepID=UPI0025CF40C3|nr:CHASE domain-containing protein [Mycolicibacterium sp.]MCB9408855.1 CHASE domain-containing protein [Mycolicibacterium sp.]
MRNSALAWLVLVVTVVATFFAWRISKTSVDSRVEQEFLSSVSGANDAISNRMLDYNIALDSAVGLLRSSEAPITRTGWKTFADSLKLRTQFRGIQALGYAVIVSPDEKANFEKGVRAEGFPDFAIKPTGDRDPYSAIRYIEPFDFRNQRAFGFDMYSEPTRREAMQSAARTGLATVSDPVQLVQETENDIQRGFLMYVPYYRDGAPVDTVEQRENALIGWVYAAFRTRDLMVGVLPPEAREYFTEIFYGDNTAAQSLLYESPRASDFKPDRVAQNSLPIGDRTWTTRFTSDKTLSPTSLEPWIVGGAGLVIDALLFVIIASLAMRRQRAEELALQMTADLRASNESLRAVTEHAKAANRAKSDFLSAMSHELRTPLNSILGFSDLLRRDPTASADQRADLDIINRSGTHLLGLINQVLEMAKIESGRTALEPSPVDLPALVNDVELMMRGPAEAAGLRFVVEMADDVARYIVCDAQKVRQIMLNLLDNSLKFTAGGGVSLRVKTVTGAGLRLVIEVEDSGAGIPEDQQQRIFEPFVRLQNVAAPGTGIGLALVADYLRLMGGEVEVTSKVGVGSLFRISIPVEPAKAGDITPVDASRRVVGLAPGQPQWRVLVVEDEPLNRQVLGRLLEQVGFVLAYAENGAQCLTIFDEFRPHFIWMDRRMPVMDGVEATSRIRQREGGREVKIAALTAAVLEDQRKEWVRAGIDGFVGKPFRESEVFDCMKSLLGVKYIYEDQADQSDTPSGIDLSPGLRALPETVRTQLAEALVIGQSSEITRAIDKVRETNPALADALAIPVADFNYGVVLEALEAGGAP